MSGLSERLAQLPEDASFGELIAAAINYIDGRVEALEKLTADVAGGALVIVGDLVEQRPDGVDLSAGDLVTLRGALERLAGTSDIDVSHGSPSGGGSDGATSGVRESTVGAVSGVTSFGTPDTNPQ